MLLDLLEDHGGGALAPVGELVRDLALLTRSKTAHGALDLLDEALGAELDDVVALRRAVLREQVDDNGVALGRRPPLDGHELADRPLHGLELGLDGFLGYLGLVLRHLELRPVRRLGLRLHLDGRREAPVLVLVRRQLVVVLRLRDRVDARPGDGAPEPPADVALDRLRVEPLLADALEQDRPRDLALPEARNADRRREVVGRVLDGVLHVVRRHLDRELDLVLSEGLDCVRHQLSH